MESGGLEGRKKRNQQPAPRPVCACCDPAARARLRVSHSVMSPAWLPSYCHTAWSVPTAEEYDKSASKTTPTAAHCDVSLDDATRTQRAQRVSPARNLVRTRDQCVRTSVRFSPGNSLVEESGSEAVVVVVVRGDDAAAGARGERDARRAVAGVSSRLLRQRSGTAPSTCCRFPIECMGNEASITLQFPSGPGIR